MDVLLNFLNALISTGLAEWTLTVAGVTIVIKVALRKKDLIRAAWNFVTGFFKKK